MSDTRATVAITGIRPASISSCILGETNRQQRSFASLSMGHIGSRPSTLAKLGLRSSGSKAGPARTISFLSVTARPPSSAD